MLKDGAQPSYFLYLQVPPNTIDINIHPTKTEIKFDDEQALYAILRASIKHSLGQFNVAPVLDFDRDSNLDTPYHYKNLEAVIPNVQVDGSYNPFSEVKPTKTFANSSFRSRIPETAHWESLYVNVKNDRESIIENNEHHFESEAVTASLFNDNEVDKACLLYTSRCV